MRKIRRNKLKRQLSTNKINDSWRNQQIERYGFKAWKLMFYSCALGFKNVKAKLIERRLVKCS